MPRRVPKASRPDTLRRERALDAALAATFPASDPVAVLEPGYGAFRARDPVPDGSRSSSQPRKKDFRP